MKKVEGNFWLWFLGLLSCWQLLNFHLPRVNAQITPDATLPNNSTVRLEGNTQIIEAGTRRGSNLFHSFQEFSIPNGSTAFFNNGIDIQNIISRVTGNSISNIDGLIRANGIANLFLINPNGIVFGKNAQLDIGASFLATTADSILFEDGIEFSAKSPQASSLLTVKVPLGLQFGSNPQDIIVEGVSPKNITEEQPGLKLSLSKTLAFIGGNIAIEDAVLNAPKGNLELGSIAESGLVNLNPTNSGWKFSYQNIQKFGNIQIDSSLINISDRENRDITSANIPNENRTLSIRSAQLDIGKSSILNANTFTPTPGSDVNIDVERLTIRGGGNITSGTFLADGEGGNLNVNATEFVEIIGTSPGGFSPSGLSTIAIGPGKAGSMKINTNELIIRDGGGIGAFVAFGNGEGGDITINSQKVRVIGRFAEDRSSQLAVGTSPNTTGNGGNLTVNTQELIIKDGGIVSAQSFGTGIAGNIAINAYSINLDNQGTLVANTRSADNNPNKEQATINITSKDLILRRNSSITTNAEGENVIGGNINISSDIITAVENSDISANSADFRGGNVNIKSRGIFGTQFSDKITPQSDITATGVSPELQGRVDINTTENQIQERPQLTSEIKQAQFDQSCQTGELASNSFTITGRGGLPVSPANLFQGNLAWEDWNLIKKGQVSQSQPKSKPKSRINTKNNQTSPQISIIVEAQGIKIDGAGNIILTAQPAEYTPNNSWSNPLNCTV